MTRRSKTQRYEVTPTADGHGVWDNATSRYLWRNIELTDATVRAGRLNAEQARKASDAALRSLLRSMIR